MSSKNVTEISKQTKPLLGRKFNPMTGAVQKRTGITKTPFLDPEIPGVNELPPTSKSSNRIHVSSRSGTTSRKNMQQGEPSLTINKITKDTACKQTLEQGYPQSYIDLFYITHDHFVDLEIKENSIMFLKEKLVRAEKLNQEDEASESFKVYHDLGSYFEGLEKFDAATYFYERCVGIASKKSLHVEEASAYQGLGNCAYMTKNIANAIEMFEKGVYISEVHGLRSSLLALSKSLTEVYRLEADKLEEEGKIDEALEHHMKCLESSRRADDLISQGNSCYRVGLIYFKQENFFKALEYLQKYLELSRAASYVDGITQALAKLAAIYQAMGNMPQAIKHLEQLNSEASENNKTSAEAEASLHLGLLYQKQGQFKRAVEFLEKHFNLARKLGDRSLIDAARVNLGVAQANCSINNYSSVLTNNLQSLIVWKNKRNKF